jgi:hypothetical protein
MRNRIHVQVLLVIVLGFLVGCGSQHSTSQSEKIDAYIVAFEPSLQSGGFTNVTMRAVPSRAGSTILVQGTARDDEELDLLTKIVMNPIINADLPCELRIDVKVQKPMGANKALDATTQ